MRYCAVCQKMLDDSENIFSCITKNCKAFCCPSCIRKPTSQAIKGKNLFLCPKCLAEHATTVVGMNRYYMENIIRSGVKVRTEGLEEEKPERRDTHEIKEKADGEI